MPRPLSDAMCAADTAFEGLRRRKPGQRVTYSVFAAPESFTDEVEEAWQWSGPGFQKTAKGQRLLQFCHDHPVVGADPTSICKMIEHVRNNLPRTCQVYSLLVHCSATGDIAETSAVAQIFGLNGHPPWPDQHMLLHHLKMFYATAEIMQALQSQGLTLRMHEHTDANSGQFNGHVLVQVPGFNTRASLFSADDFDEARGRLAAIEIAN